VAAIASAGCRDQSAGWLPVSALSRDGFAADPGAAGAARGQEVRVWGFVDHGNLYGDAGARRILGDWWAGNGPDDRTWRFNLKPEASAPVGRSFPVHVANDQGRDALLEHFVADARAGRPTRVFVRGSLLTFSAPTQFRALTGLYLEVPSSRMVGLEPSGGGVR
jgi:hypothetical protein